MNYKTISEIKAVNKAAGSIDTVEEFQAYDTLQEARKALLSHTFR